MARSGTASGSNLNYAGTDTQASTQAGNCGVLKFKFVPLALTSGSEVAVAVSRSACQWQELVVLVVPAGVATT